MTHFEQVLAERLFPRDLPQTAWDKLQRELSLCGFKLVSAKSQNDVFECPECGDAHLASFHWPPATTVSETSS